MFVLGKTFYLCDVSVTTTALWEKWAYKSNNIFDFGILVFLVGHFSLCVCIEPASPFPSAISAEAIAISAVRQNSVLVVASSFLAAYNCCCQLGRNSNSRRKTRDCGCLNARHLFVNGNSRPRKTAGPNARRGRHRPAPFQSSKRAAAWQRSWKTFPQSLQRTPYTSSAAGHSRNYFHKLSFSRHLITQTFKGPRASTQQIYYNSLVNLKPALTSWHILQCYEYNYTKPNSNIFCYKRIP